jgi:hypothetical protein
MIPSKKFGRKRSKNHKTWIKRKDTKIAQKPFQESQEGDKN